MARELSELVDAYMDENKLYRTEGRRGVETLCQLSSALGYKDPQYWGQLTSKAILGDLVCFLEDNSGAIEAIIEWVRNQNSPEMVQSLEALVSPAKAVEQYPGGICPDCGEEINPDAVVGSECDNCGHVFVEQALVDDTWNDSDGQGA